MAEKEKRFWQHRRFWGGLCVTLGTALVAIPGAPVIATLGTIAVTTQVAGILIGGVGTHVFSYGQGAAAERKNSSK